MLDHRYLGKVPSVAERSQAQDYLKSVNEDLVPSVMTVQCGDSGDIFLKYVQRHICESFSHNLVEHSMPVNHSRQAKLRQQMLSLCYQLFTVTATTAGLETIFSSWTCALKTKKYIGKQEGS